MRQKTLNDLMNWGCSHQEAEKSGGEAPKINNRVCNPMQIASKGNYKRH